MRYKYKLRLGKSRDTPPISPSIEPQASRSVLDEKHPVPVSAAPEDLPAPVPNETLVTEVGVVKQDKVSDGDLFDDSDFNSTNQGEQQDMLQILNQTIEDPFYTLKELRERQNMKYMTTDDSNVRCVPLCQNRGICQMGQCYCPYPYSGKKCEGKA